MGDTDRDGRMEIVTSHDSFGSGSIFLIFENRGDNEYALVFADTIAYFGDVGNNSGALDEEVGSCGSVSLAADSRPACAEHW